MSGGNYPGSGYPGPRFGGAPGAGGTPPPWSSASSPAGGSGSIPAQGQTGWNAPTGSGAYNQGFGGSGGWNASPNQRGFSGPTGPAYGQGFTEQKGPDPKGKKTSLLVGLTVFLLVANIVVALWGVVFPLQDEISEPEPSPSIMPSESPSNPEESAEDRLERRKRRGKTLPAKIGEWTLSIYGQSSDRPDGGSGSSFHIVQAGPESKKIDPEILKDKVSFDGGTCGLNDSKREIVANQCFIRNKQGPVYIMTSFEVPVDQMAELAKSIIEYI